jgi:nucleoside-diphosphate-sugar epimerase
MDLFDLSGKTAVVTGGSRGIGLMMARGLLQAGARVYISSRNSPSTAPSRPFPLTCRRSRSACGWPPRSASANVPCTSWSTTPVPPGARR